MIWTCVSPDEKEINKKCKRLLKKMWNDGIRK